MAQFPALPLWTDALLGDTQHLSMGEFGAYILTLIVAWRDPDCSLPNDDLILARITRAGRHWARVKQNVLGFWTLGADNRLRQKRLSAERLKVQERSQALGTRRAGKPRKTKETTQSTDSQSISISNKKEDPVLPRHPVLTSNTQSSIPTAAGGGEAFKFHPRYGEVSRKVEEILQSKTVTPFVRTPIDKWLKAGADPEADIYPAIEAKLGQWQGRNLNFFDYAVADALRARTSPMPEGRQKAASEAWSPAKAIEAMREDDRRRAAAATAGGHAE